MHRTLTQPSIILSIRMPKDTELSLTKQDFCIQYLRIHDSGGFPIHSNAFTQQKMQTTYNMKSKMHEADYGRSPKSDWLGEHKYWREDNKP